MVEAHDMEYETLFREYDLTTSARDTLSRAISDHVHCGLPQTRKMNGISRKRGMFNRSEGDIACTRRNMKI